MLSGPSKQKYFMIIFSIFKIKTNEAVKTHLYKPNNMVKILVILLSVFVAAIFGTIIRSFLDQAPMSGPSFEKKWKALIKVLNDAAFEGLGSVYLNTENSCNIYKDRENQII